MKLNKKERAAIQALHGLQEIWPESLWLLALDGCLHVMRCDENGNRVYCQDGVDYDYSWDEVDIPSESGEWGE